jgi:hypothetical protein
MIYYFFIMLKRFRGSKSDKCVMKEKILFDDEDLFIHKKEKVMPDKKAKVKPDKKAKVMPDKKTKVKPDKKTKVKPDKIDNSLSNELSLISLKKSNEIAKNKTSELLRIKNDEHLYSEALDAYVDSIFPTIEKLKDFAETTGKKTYYIIDASRYESLNDFRSISICNKQCSYGIVNIRLNETSFGLIPKGSFDIYNRLLPIDEIIKRLVKKEIPQIGRPMHRKTSNKYQVYYKW